VPEKTKAEVDESGAVLTANRAFYRAFRSRDVAAIERLWAEKAGLICIHPGWEALTRREEIIESWRGILESPNAPSISCQDESVRFVGETAIVLCTEVIEGRVLVATNVFTRENGAWRMMLHHATPTARTLAPRKAETPKTLH